MTRLLYDEETGAPDRKVLEEELLASEALELEKARQVERMSHMDGWKQVESWLSDVIAGCKEKLVDVDPREATTLIQLQQTIRAYSNVIGFVHQRVNDLQQRRLASAEPKTGGDADNQG